MMALVGRALTRASARNGLLPAGAVVTALPATPAVETPVPGRPVRRGVDEPGRGRGTQHATQIRRVGGVRDEQLLQLAGRGDPVLIRHPDDVAGQHRLRRPA